jgi:hypothetical protein
VHPLLAATSVAEACTLARSDAWHLLGLTPQAYRRIYGALDDPHGEARRGTVSTRANLAHTDGINSVYLALLGATRLAGGELRWRGEWACTHTYLRSGSYFPSWLDARKRGEQALGHAQPVLRQRGALQGRRRRARTHTRARRVRACPVRPATASCASRHVRLVVLQCAGVIGVLALTRLGVVHGFDTQAAVVGAGRGVHGAVAGGWTAGAMSCPGGPAVRAVVGTACRAGCGWLNQRARRYVYTGGGGCVRRRP